MTDMRKGVSTTLPSHYTLAHAYYGEYMMTLFNFQIMCNLGIGLQPDQIVLRKLS